MSESGVIGDTGLVLAEGNHPKLPKVRKQCLGDIKRLSSLWVLDRNLICR